MVGIYKITSPSGSIYIGQSIDIKKRWSDYKYIRKSKSQTRLHNSFKKYGIEKHTFEVIKECSIDCLNNLEKYYINSYSTFNTKHGLNLTSGGCQLSICSDETKMKIKVAVIKAIERKKVMSFMDNKDDLLYYERSITNEQEQAFENEWA